MMSQPSDPWERALRGLHTVVLGLPLREPPQDLRVVRVSCDVPPTTLGPLLEARSRIEKVLGTGAPFVEIARARVMTGIRRHLLGDLPSVTSEGSIVDVWNRFASLGPAVLVLEAAESADAASLDTLRHILGRPGWLRLPLLISMKGEAIPLAAAQLVDAVRTGAGEAAILRAPPSPAASLVDAKTEYPKRGDSVSPHARTMPLSPEANAAVEGASPSIVVVPPSREGLTPGLRELPADVLRVLRALAIAGSGCEASVLAAVLESSELSVLDAAQRASDAGVPIEDRGEGRFHLPETTIEILRASILPSLAAALHRRVATIVGRSSSVPTPAAQQVPSSPPPVVPALSIPPQVVVAEPRPGDAWDVMAAPRPISVMPPPHDTERPISSVLATERSAARSSDESAARAADEVVERAQGEPEPVPRPGAVEIVPVPAGESSSPVSPSVPSTPQVAAARLTDRAPVNRDTEIIAPRDIESAARSVEIGRPRDIESLPHDARSPSPADAESAPGVSSPVHAPEVDEAAQRAAEEAALAVQRARDEVLARAKEEAEIRAAQRALRAQEEAATHTAEAAQRAADEEATRVALEAAEQAQEEMRRIAEAEGAAEAVARAEEKTKERAAEEAAVQAVESARREIDDPERAPAYYKPFTGAPPPLVPRPAGKWMSPMAAEPEPPRARGQVRAASNSAAHSRGSRSIRSSGPPRDEAHVTPRTPIRAVPRDVEVTMRDTPQARALRSAMLDDDARAARHLAAAGDSEAAVGRYVEAMSRAAAAAAYPNAVAHARAALQLLERLPPTEERRLQRVQVQLEAGRVLWHGAGPDESFTLQGALRVLESARTSLHAGDPAELVAEVAVTIAGILYDIGDLASLQRALEELANASRALSEAGEPRAAARLFNDQAAVHMRLGDPVRAAHLLTESRNIFEEASKSDPVAMAEMAETDHLFARILLQVPARPGREDDALALGLDHAIAAERSFRRLGAPREASRVLTTMGRIEARRGRLTRAAERITAAVKLQESIGDVVGLARSTAALSEVLAEGGQIREALHLLADSLVLNFEKGSGLGLAFNRRSLEALAHLDAANEQAGDLVREIEARLAVMEEKLGRIPIPGTPDNPPPEG
ncbi:MAG: hypothetical protein U0441_17025 [Polyangiaceae bacterium]